jgi:thiol:disulfide interchange protein DsbC
VKKKVIATVFLGLALCSPLGAAERSGPAEKIKNLLPPNVRVESFSYKDNLNMYEVVVSGGVFYVSQDFRYLFIGNVIDTLAGKNLTEEKMNAIRKVDFGALDKKAAIKIGEGRRSIAVFTDPDCPHCQKLHAELKKLKDVTVYLYFYPLESLHPVAKAKATAMWCNKKDTAFLDAVMAGGSMPAREAVTCASPIDANIKAAKKLGINSTPAIITDNNRIIKGYVPAEKIMASLQEGK